MPDLVDQADLRDAIASIEAAFQAHTAVREVRVVPRSAPGGVQFACYVVAHEASLPPPAAPAEDPLVKRWGKVFDLMHTGAAVAAEPPSARWTSSYTRQAFDPDEIEEWLAATVSLVRARSPSSVLELGCGSGVLAVRLAPRCTRYVGTDLSARSLERLASYVSSVRPRLDHLTLVEAPAHALGGLGGEAFDLVLANSVVQYFPNEAYLRQVLESALRVTRPGGTIMLGDVRSLPLLPLLCASIELFRAPAELSSAELGERIARRLVQQDELVIAPAWFHAWAVEQPTVASVQLLPKRGQRVNEFSAYRYDVVVHVGPRSRTRVVPEWVDWEPALTGEALAARLREPGCERLALRQVANARVTGDLAAWNAVRAGEATRAGSLRQALEARAPFGLSPEDVHLLAERAGYRAELSFCRSAADGAFDAVMERREVPEAPIDWGEPVEEARSPGINDPARGIRRQSLVPQLLAHVKQRLRPEWVPSSLLVVDEIPSVLGNP